MYFNKSIAVVAFAALAACGGDSHEVSRPPESAPVRVTAAALTPEEWPDTFEATGSVRARTSATISSRVMGYIQEVRAQAGDRVTAGQTLVVIDSRDMDTAVRQAQAGLAEARSAQPEVAGAVASASAQLELARTTLRRMQELLDKRSVSQQEFDEAAARVKMAEAGHAMAQAKGRQLEEKIRQAEQAVQQANIMKGYAAIQAPFAGRVTARMAEPGVLASPGMPLFELEREGGFRLEASVEETRLGAVRQGESVTVTLDAVDSPLSGRVAEIVPAVNESSRSFTVKIDLPSNPALRTGLFGRALFGAGKRNVLAVPRESVAAAGQVLTVMVAADGYARRRMVTTGAARDGRVEILSGLSEGDRLIHPTPAGLADGARVEAGQ